MLHQHALKKHHLIRWCFLFAAAAFAGCVKEKEAFESPLLEDSYKTSNKAANQSAEVAHAWFRLQLSFMLERNSTLSGTAFAYLGVGLYESVRHGIKNSVSFSTKLNQMPAMPETENNQGYHWDISANAAMAAMLRSFNTGLTPANHAAIDDLEARFNRELGPSEQSASFRRSQAYGRQVAEAIFNWSQQDNWNASNAGYVPPTGAGLWRPTPPANVPIPIFPYLRYARTFVPANDNLTGPAFPIAFNTTPGSDFYNMAKEVFDVNQALTDDQKSTARFWVDQGNGIGYTPNGHDISLVVQALEQYGAKLGLAAEAYAKAGIAQRDGSIVVFRTKYVNNLIRPVSYIQDHIQGGWLPYITTPPHPEYPAAHSGVTGSTMQALSEVLGESVPVTDRTYASQGFSDRNFPNLFAAAEDAGISRLYGGIHYRVSIEAGLDLARIVGKNVGEIAIKP